MLGAQTITKWRLVHVWIFPDSIVVCMSLYRPNKNHMYVCVRNLHLKTISDGLHLNVTKPLCCNPGSFSFSEGW